jgi:transcriptional regulator with GAF, ATPase, and Fis domain
MSNSGKETPDTVSPSRELSVERIREMFSIMAEAIEEHDDLSELEYSSGGESFKVTKSTDQTVPTHDLDNKIHNSLDSNRPKLTSEFMNDDDDQKLFNKFKKMGFIGRSHAMRDVFKKIVKYAKSNHHILITGPTGTGKELVAEAIHLISGKLGEMVKVNSGGLPENTIESELFGHKKGAFTDARDDRKGYFETANNGTLFLDEIGELPLKLQPKFLRILDEGTFMRMGDSIERKSNARVVTATNRDLDTMVVDGIFREDLFYRLNTFEIKLPPLNERKEDIPFIAKHLFKNEIIIQSGLGWDYCKPKFKLSHNLFNLLENRDWSGDVRGLDKYLIKVYAEIENIKEISRENFLKILADPNTTLTNSMSSSRDDAGIFRNDKPYFEAFEWFIKCDYNKSKANSSLKSSLKKDKLDPRTSKAWIHSAFLQIAKHVEYKIEDIPNLTLHTYDFRIDDIEKFIKETEKILIAIADSYHSNTRPDKKSYMKSDLTEGLLDYLFEKRHHLKKE